METQSNMGTTKKMSKKLMTPAHVENQYVTPIATSSATTTTKVSITKLEDSTIKTQTKTMHGTKKESVKSAYIEEVNGEESMLKEQLVQENGSCKNGTDDGSSKKSSVYKKKHKTKNNKKGEADKYNISVKSSFNKFDALQKRNLIHVRSIDASTAQEKFSNPQGKPQTNCYLCNKMVYKMEEIKAEKNIYHKNCFRCYECRKQLKVDTYQSHGGVLYCAIHFKLLFAPKFVEEEVAGQPRKPELIIRENQPAELPPDVFRACDKPDLGLEELQQLNVRSRFQVFEQGKSGDNEDLQEQDVQKIKNTVRRSESILSKVAKLQQLGGNAQMNSTVSSENEDNEGDDDNDINLLFDNPNTYSVRQKKNEHERERPIGIGEAMNDIRTLFEKGHGITKEERREERKQEIQNIRSRLFMGKQARIKEMYQQAVAESEYAVTAANKKSDIEIEVDSKSLRNRFETGEIFKDNQVPKENDGGNSKKGAIEREADVFESAISKRSRSIFMELDANVVTGKNQNILPSQSSSKILQQQKSVGGIANNDVVKSGEVIEDVKIETADISEKFKFFEKYHPTENKKQAFRITPPREGVVKMPSPDENSNDERNSKEVSPDRNIIAHSRTTSIMLNKFRELEKNPNSYVNNSSRTMKCFTPPLDGNCGCYISQNSDEYDSNEEEDDDPADEGDDSELDEYDGNYSHFPKDDEALREAKNAARAKQLRSKFEKWQANEIEREKSEELNRNNIYSNNATNENSMQSTQTIREKFEKMHSNERTPQPSTPRYKVNRFV